MAAFPELKSAVVAPFAVLAEMIQTLARSLGSIGLGALVRITIVWSSTRVTFSMPRVNCEKEFGELGTLGTRSMVNSTSSAVKGDPSWNTTPLRSLNSQVRSSCSFHDWASAGATRSFSSRTVSLS